MCVTPRKTKTSIRHHNWGGSGTKNFKPLSETDVWFSETALWFSFRAYGVQYVQRSLKTRFEFPRNEIVQF
jgi:hypothetical protein